MNHIETLYQSGMSVSEIVRVTSLTKRHVRKTIVAAAKAGRVVRRPQQQRPQTICDAILNDWFSANGLIKEISERHHVPRRSVTDIIEAARRKGDPRAITSAERAEAAKALSMQASLVEHRSEPTIAERLGIRLGPVVERENLTKNGGSRINRITLSGGFARSPSAVEA